MKDSPLLLLASLGLLGVVGGCVSPGEMDVDLVGRYQRAMAARGAQVRAGTGGLDLLRPTRSETGPKLAVEPIVVDRVVETTATHRLLGTLEDPETKQLRKRVEIGRTIKTTTYRRDGATGKRTSKESIDEKKPRIALLDEVPRDVRDVDIYRVGERSRAPARLPRSKHLVRLSLRDTVMRALANNLDIRVVSYDPAISREDMVRAAAAFDYTVFGAVSYTKDEKQRAQTFAGDINRLRNWSLGVRQHTVTGAEWSLEWAMSRAWDNSSSFFTTLRTRYEPTVVLQVSQPLLRDAWPEVNLAQLRIARLNTRIGEQDFRAKVEEVITQVVSTYWALVQARREVEIAERLLEVTRETYERVIGRADLDATEASIKQVEASVRIRQAALIRARKIAQDVQDALARLLADVQINVLSGYEVVPTTPAIEEQVHVSATEQMMTALRHNPLLEQARLAVAASAINVRVAKNQTLPNLELTASTGLQGLSRQAKQAHDELFRGDYLSYSIGLTLEYPVGNRERLASLRQRQFEYTKAIVSMQNAADQIALAVNERARQIETAHEELLAQRAAVEAARIQLQALEDTERIRGRLTPEFLRVKLDAQVTLATAARSETQALVDYNTAMAELARATGTTLELHRVRIAMPHAVNGTWPAIAPPGGMPATGPAKRKGQP